MPTTSPLERTTKSVLFKIQPIELQFPLELKKRASSLVKLTNNSDHYVAFKVMTTNKKHKYWVKPNMGVLLAHSSCDVTVTMQAQNEYPADMQCKDKFAILSAVVKPPGFPATDITPETFTCRESGNQAVDECKLRVSYVLPTSPKHGILEAALTSIRRYLSMEYSGSARRVRDSTHWETTTYTGSLLSITTSRQAQTSTTLKVQRRRNKVEEKPLPLPAADTKAPPAARSKKALSLRFTFQVNINIL